MYKEESKNTKNSLESDLLDPVSSLDDYFVRNNDEDESSSEYKLIKIQRIMNSSPSNEILADKKQSEEDSHIFYQSNIQPSDERVEQMNYGSHSASFQESSEEIKFDATHPKPDVEERKISDGYKDRLRNYFERSRPKQSNRINDSGYGLDPNPLIQDISDYGEENVYSDEEMVDDEGSKGRRIS